MKNIYFDMDGTIADLYGYDGWLDDIINERVRPYAEAKPLVNMNSLARVLNRLVRNGYTVNVISWTAKNGRPDYNEAVADTKRKWLKKHLASVQFENVFVIPYGTPKASCGYGILFDDEKPNRDNWNGQAYDEKNILQVLRNL